MKIYLVLHDLLLMKIRCLLLTGPIDKISLWWTIMHTTVLGVCVRDPPRFFDQVGHQTYSASIGNKHFFTKKCHRQTYQNYEKVRQKLGTFFSK